MRKLIIFILICVNVLTACQPTPEDLVVQNKKDNDLKQAIAVTAEPTNKPPQTTATPEPAVHITDSWDNDAGTVKVNIDTNVDMPQLSKIPVANIELDDIGVEQVKQIYKAFFGDSLMYAPVYTKANIEASILRIQKKLADDDALLNSDAASALETNDLSIIRKEYEKSIESLQRQWKNAPTENPVIDNFDSALTQRGLFASVDIGKEYMGYIETSRYDAFTQISCRAIGGEWPRMLRHLEFRNATPIDLETTDEAIDTAKQAAQNLIDNTKIQGVRLGAAFKTKDYPGLVSPELGKLSSNREFYVFCFEREVGEASIAYTFCKGGHTEEETQKCIPYEKLEVWVEGNNVVQFRWFEPMKVTKIVNENVALAIDLDKAIELMKKQAYIQFVDNQLGYFDHQIVDVKRIAFELVRVKERNTGNYIVVPAWSFYGKLNSRLTEKYVKVWNRHGEKHKVGDYISRLDRGYNDTLVTINALDGTVIDMEKGY